MGWRRPPPDFRDKFTRENNKETRKKLGLIAAWLKKSKRKELRMHRGKTRDKFVSIIPNVRTIIFMQISRALWTRKTRSLPISSLYLINISPYDRREIGRLAGKYLILAHVLRWGGRTGGERGWEDVTHGTASGGYAY